MRKEDCYGRSCKEQGPMSRAVSLYRTSRDDDRVATRPTRMCMEEQPRLLEQCTEVMGQQHKAIGALDSKPTNVKECAEPDSTHTFLQSSVCTAGAVTCTTFSMLSGLDQTQHGMAAGATAQTSQPLGLDDR